MDKFFRKQFFLFVLIVAITIVSLLTLPLYAKVIESFNRPTAIVHQNKLIQSSWSDILVAIFRRKKVPGGTQGDNDYCMIAPGKFIEKEQDLGKEIWSDIPLFIWQGKILEVEVRQEGSNELVSRIQSLDGKTQIPYPGNPLQPGTTYFWRDGQSSNKLYRRKFRLMKKKERDEIAAKLEQLETSLKAEGTSPQQLAQKRVDFFVEQQLLSDALQEIYSQPNFFSEQIKQIQAIDFCSSSNSQSA